MTTKSTKPSRSKSDTNSIEVGPDLQNNLELESETKYSPRILHVAILCSFVIFISLIAGFIGFVIGKEVAACTTLVVAVPEAPQK